MSSKIKYSNQDDITYYPQNLNHYIEDSSKINSINMSELNQIIGSDSQYIISSFPPYDNYTEENVNSGSENVGMVQNPPGEDNNLNVITTSTRNPSRYLTGRSSRNRHNFCMICGEYHAVGVKCRIHDQITCCSIL